MAVLNHKSFKVLSEMGYCLMPVISINIDKYINALHFLKVNNPLHGFEFVHICQCLFNSCQAEDFKKTCE